MSKEKPWERKRGKASKVVEEKQMSRKESEKGQAKLGMERVFLRTK